MWHDERALYEREYQCLAMRRSGSPRGATNRALWYAEIVEHLYNKKLMFTARSIQEAVKRSIKKRPHISEFFVIDFLQELGIMNKGEEHATKE